MGIAYYDGNAIFGLAVAVQHLPNPSAQQTTGFFGVTGTQLVFGGGRGRVFQIKGVLIGVDLAGLAAAEATLLSYDDGIARTLTDCWGRNWPQVVFTGQYQPDPVGPRPFDGGWALAYRATFRGLL
jgi:hypothetical protein